MSFRVQLSARAAHYLDRLDSGHRERFRRAMALLAEDPFDIGSKPLKGRTDRSYRVGGWRILYDVDREAQVVRVNTIAPRGQAYRER